MNYRIGKIAIVIVFIILLFLLVSTDFGGRGFFTGCWHGLTILVRTLFGLFTPNYIVLPPAGVAYQFGVAIGVVFLVVNIYRAVRR